MWPLPILASLVVALDNVSSIMPFEVEEGTQTNPKDFPKREVLSKMVEGADTQIGFSESMNSPLNDSNGVANL